MSGQSKRWRCPYCRQTKTSQFKPPKEKCSGRRDPKTKEFKFHVWERVG